MILLGTRTVALVKYVRDELVSNAPHHTQHSTQAG
jgi:hypothetical protein